MSKFGLPPEEASIVSVTDRVTKVALNGPASAVHFLGDVAAFVGTEENVTLATGGDTNVVAVHGGGILCSTSDGKRVVMGGDDGKLVSLDAKSTIETLATDTKRRWIDNVALHADGAVAWSAGKTAFVRNPKGDEKSLDVPSTVGGLAFAPKGVRLAVAHYNGVTLWFPNMGAKPEFLEWKGSHLGVTFSADNRFLVTSMHESALHGWRLADSRHMRMTGYPARVRSMSWSAGGKFLATSGSDSVILWPFRQQGRADGQGAAHAGAAAGQGDGGCLQSEGRGLRGRLQRRHHPDGPDRGRRGNPGAPECGRAGGRAGVECEGIAARLRNRRRRRWTAHSVVSKQSSCAF
jgi:hypothetical protein